MVLSSWNGYRSPKENLPLFPKNVPVALKLQGEKSISLSFRGQIMWTVIWLLKVQFRILFRDTCSLSSLKSKTNARELSAVLSYISQIAGLRSKIDKHVNKTQSQNPFHPSGETMGPLSVQTAPEIHPLSPIPLKSRKLGVQSCPPKHTPLIKNNCQSPACSCDSPGYLQESKNKNMSLLSHKQPMVRN